MQQNVNSTQTHTHTYILTHKHTHLYSHTLTHIYIYSDTLADIYTYVYVCTAPADKSSDRRTRGENIETAERAVLQSSTRQYTFLVVRA